ncbi:MAG: hypothetical protein ABJB98_11105, partial [Actinomycetota bacterium]
GAAFFTGAAFLAGAAFFTGAFFAGAFLAAGAAVRAVTTRARVAALAAATGLRVALLAPSDVALASRSARLILADRAGMAAPSVHRRQADADARKWCVREGGKYTRPRAASPLTTPYANAPIAAERTSAASVGSIRLR